ncbi:MAG: DUF4907 domain-containing protein [Bacteroidales bacterium]|nr:DUF4907 domain-containing protein [Bacteroidales bacterium]
MRSFVVWILIAMVAIVGWSCNGNSADTKPVSLKYDTTLSIGKFTVETHFYEKDTARGIESGYGYSVSVNDKKLINQRFVPVVEGYNRFATAEDALNTGKVVVDKMIHSADLPSLVKEDLIKLGILKSDGTLNNKK